MIEKFTDLFGRVGSKYYVDGELWVDIEPPQEFDGKYYYDADYFIQKSDKGGYGDTMKWNSVTRTWWEKHAENIIIETAALNALDVGCGMGRLIHGLVVNGIDAWGLEISEYASKNSWGESKGKIICGDIKEKDIINIIEKHTSYEEFSLTSAYEVFEHITKDNIEIALDNFAKLTRIGGYSHIAVPISRQILRCLHDSTHVLGRPESWWRNEFTTRGYEIIDNTGWTHCRDDDFRCFLKKVDG